MVGAGYGLLETHAHTPLCRHATGAPGAYCREALRKGLSGIIFTDHNPMPSSYLHQDRIPTNQLGAYVAMVSRVRKQYEGELSVFIGIECDYLPEYANYVAAQVAARDYDYILGSVHCQLPNFWVHATPDQPTHFERTYLEMLARAAETRLFHALSHPHLAALVLERHNDMLYEDICVCLDRIAASDTAIELNTSGFGYWHDLFYREAAARRIPVILAGDAHAPEEVGRCFWEALIYLQAMGFTSIACRVRKHQHEIPIADALGLLPPVPCAEFELDAVRR